MTSLYRRANPSQRRILKIVEGAVKNASDCHPEIVVPSRFRRSIAKRAAGTLSAQWPEVLAARGTAPSERDAISTVMHKTGRRLAPQVTRPRGRRERTYDQLPPLGRLRKQITDRMWDWSRNDHPRAEAMIQVLRWIAELEAA